jgi:serine/threonine protein kinase/WD40 repeat protein
MPKPPLRHLEELFHQAVALEPSQRPAFLDTACAGDAELRAAVEQLLKHDLDHDSLVDSLVSPVATQVERLRPSLSPVLDGAQNRPEPAQAFVPTIEGYELLEEIGRGGMGIVYKARQISLNRIVALKMLLAIQPISTEELERFRSEAEALARLHHPNIVTIFEIAESEGRPYFTMEYIAGPSLADILKGHPQDVALAVRLLETVARAVHAIHECGFIHRDLKPANILLQGSGIGGQETGVRGRETGGRDQKTGVSDQESGGRGRETGKRWHDLTDPCLLTSDSWLPKITDFGIAKHQDVERKLTKTGAVLGTPSYMAPEQARGNSAIGPTTDIYSLGAILYEMLTGRAPFDASDQATTIAQLLHDEPLSPFRLRPSLPPDVVTICMKCLEKLPRKRYQTALELADDLERFRAGKPIRARPVRFPERVYRWCRRRPLVAGLLALCALLALTCVATVIVYEILLNEALKAQIAAEDKQLAEQKEHIVQLHARIGVAAMEEGNTFAAVFHFTEALRFDEGSEREGLHRLRIGAALRRCPWPTQVLTLEREILCAEHDRVVMVGPNHALDVRELYGTQSIASGLSQPEQPSEGTISPDDRFLGVLSDKGAATIWDLSERRPHHLASERGQVKGLRYHPNSRVLLVERTNGTREAWDLANWSQLPWEALSGKPPFSRLGDDGRWLLTCDADHNAQVWDMGTGKSAGPALQLGHHIHAGAVAAEGRTVAVVGPDNDLSVWDTTSRRPLGKPIRLPDAVSRVAVSPDGERVATMGTDRVLRIWQMRVGTLLSQTSMPEDATTWLRFNDHTPYLLAWGEVGGARVFDATTGQTLTPPLRHGGRLVSAEFRASNRELATVSKNGVVCVWELPRGPERRLGAANTVVSSPGAANRSIRLANGTTVKTNGATDGPLNPPAQGEHLVDRAVLSPDGGHIVLCDDAVTVLACDTAGQEKGPLSLRHRSPVRYAAFSANGQRILTACEDRTVRLWDAATGELLAPPMRHASDIQRVVFGGTAGQAQVVEKDGTVSLWELKEDTHSLEALLALSRIMAGEQAEPGQRLRPLDARALRENWEKLSSAR